MSARTFMNGVGQALAWTGKNMVWPATKAVFGLLWFVVCALVQPCAKSAGEGLGKVMPFLVVVGVVVGGLYGLLHAPKHLQEQGVAIVALTIFCLVLWAVLKPSTKKADPPARHNGRRRRR